MTRHPSEGQPDQEIQGLDMQKVFATCITFTLVENFRNKKIPTDDGEVVRLMVALDNFMALQESAHDEANATLREIFSLHVKIFRRFGVEPYAETFEEAVRKLKAETTSAKTEYQFLTQPVEDIFEHVNIPASRKTEVDILLEQLRFHHDVNVRVSIASLDDPELKMKLLEIREIYRQFFPKLETLTHTYNLEAMPPATLRRFFENFTEVAIAFTRKSLMEVLREIQPIQ